MTDRSYEQPVVRDLGDLVELTAATGLINDEDGGSKLTFHHVSNPSAP